MLIKPGLNESSVNERESLELGDRVSDVSDVMSRRLTCRWTST